VNSSDAVDDKGNAKRITTKKHVLEKVTRKISKKGLIIAAAFIGPGAVTTASIAGAGH
jgi:hypothetical protein